MSQVCKAVSGTKRTRLLPLRSARVSSQDGWLRTGLVGPRPSLASMRRRYRPSHRPPCDRNSSIRDVRPEDPGAGSVELHLTRFGGRVSTRSSSWRQRGCSASPRTRTTSGRSSTSALSSFEEGPGGIRAGHAHAELARPPAPVPRSCEHWDTARPLRRVKEHRPNEGRAMPGVRSGLPEPTNGAGSRTT